MNIGKLNAQPKCPQCGMMLDGYGCVSAPDFVPGVGSLTVCCYCFTPLEFGEGLKLQLLDVAKLPEEAQRDIRRAVKVGEIRAGHETEDELSEKFIYPTHHCFGDALELLAKLYCRRFLIKGLRLVHAVCEAPDGSGELYVHAYVQDVESGESQFVGLFEGEKVVVVVETGKYETGLQIVEATRYTVEEALALNLQTESYGPWLERYRELCSNKQRIYRDPGDPHQKRDGAQRG